MKFSVTLLQLHLLQRYCKISMLIRELNELNSNKRFYRIQNIIHIKVAGKVKLTLAFMEWFFLQLGNTDQVIQNSIPTFRQSSIISEKPGYLSEKMKTLTSSNYYKVYHFLLKFCTRFLLNNVCKRIFGIFFILFRSWVINKKVKNECVETRSFSIFENSSRSK